MYIHSSIPFSASFQLDKASPSKTFYFTLPDFKIYIQRIRFVIAEEHDNWQELITKTEISLHVKYKLALQEMLEQFKELSFPIHLFVDANNIQPCFTINKLIDKNIFGQNIELDKISRIEASIELIENQPIDFPYHVVVELN